MYIYLPLNVLFTFPWSQLNQYVKGNSKLAMTSPDYFTSNPDWEAYATKNGYPLPSNNAGPPSSETIEPLDFDIAQARAGEVEEDLEWAEAHPLESVGYVAHLTMIKVRDGAEI